MTKKSDTPAIRFKGFTDTWEQRKLGEMGQTYTGLSGKTKDDFGHGSGKFITYMNVFSNPVASSNMTEAIEIDDSQNKVQFGDVLFTTSSETPDEVGMSSVWLENAENTYLNSFCFGYRPTTEYNPYYLAYMLRSSSMRKKITFLAQGISRYNISKNKMMDIEMPIPSIDEQKQIGEYFRNLDNLITLHQRKYDKLTNVKKSMLEKMFPKNGSNVPEIRFKGFTEAWEQRKLGEMGQTYTGLSGKTKDDFGHGSGKFITYMNVFSNPVASSNMTEAIEIDDSQNKVQFGDVLFTTSSETPDEVGMSSVWLENAENTYLNSFCFGYRPTTEYNPYYLAYMLRSSSMRKKITFLAQGISRYNISKNKMMDIEMPIPSIDEQKQIGEYFRNLDNLITLHQRELEKLKNIKKSCLENMFV